MTQVVYPSSDIKDYAIHWPDMSENFPCEALTPGYGLCGGANPAEWVMRLTPCCDWSRHKGYVLICSACKDILLRGPLVCRGQRTFPGCDREFRPGSTAYTSIEPLGLK